MGWNKGQDTGSRRVDPAAQWNRTEVAFEPGLRLGDLIVRALETHGGHEALKFGTDSLDYRTLHGHVHAIAWALRSQGIGPGDRVGVCAQRGFGMFESILGVLVSGAAFVPVDPLLPTGRLEEILEDARLGLLLGPEADLDLLDGELTGRLPVRSTESLLSEGGTLSGDSPVVCGDPDDLAYIFFTSGSTGRPKGAMNTHRAVVNRLLWGQANWPIGPGHRFLQKTSFTFDVSVWEYLWPLTQGATLVIARPGGHRDPAYLARTIRDERIGVMTFVPSMLRMFLEVPEAADCPRLEHIIAVGEALPADTVERVHRVLPQTRLYNHYGPTETAIEVTWYECDPMQPRSPVPIGRPIANTRIYVLDPEGVPLPIGEVGEICIAGVQVGPGYFGRPDLTAERFLPDPFEPGGRMYRTGDLGRWTEEGLVECLGRLDFQVKLRGNRIELEEIEARLRAHPRVADCVAGVVDDPTGEARLVAWVAARGEPAPGSDDVLAFAAETLPEYMLPEKLQWLPELPLLTSGKVDRKSLAPPDFGPLPSPAAAHGGPRRAPVSDPCAARSLIAGLWRELLGTPELEADANLFDAGARSVLVMGFISRLQAAGVHAIGVGDVYDRPSIRALQDLVSRSGAEHEADRRARRSGGPVAIVGMSVRAPGAQDVEAFWNLLVQGGSGIRRFTADELDPGVPESLRSRPNFVPCKGIVEGAEHFDAAYFGIAPREATLIDPQQRLLLELAVQALEHAGIDPERCPDIGVYAGTATASYLAALRQHAASLVEQSGEFATTVANDKDYVATRIAHRVGLRGPAIAIHTACSTGLVAAAMAVESLRSGQCDVALAGGATVIVPQRSGHLHVAGGMESGDGHCRPFEARASGTVFSGGAGLVVLKRLEDAMADGDTVYAVVEGIGVNNDGGHKASFTAPSVEGQARAIRRALSDAGCSGADIGYMEAHGTGTPLGDPIEVSGLVTAWERDGGENGRCALGSIKANIGHTIAAAGVLGLIRCALSLHRELIPAPPDFHAPNPQIDFATTPFRIPVANEPWPRSGTPRRAAVSSFGVGGTNAHMVLAEAPGDVSVRQHRASTGPWLLPLSAADADALKRSSSQLAGHLRARPELALDDVVHTLVRGRQARRCRGVVSGVSRDEILGRLEAGPAVIEAGARPRLVLLFPGQGSQHPGMAAGLHEAFPAFAEAFDEAWSTISPHLDIDLRALLLKPDAGEDDAALLAQTRHAQPALFLMGYALARWLDDRGLEPAAMIGHSIGEYAAIAAAGMLPLRDVAACVCARGAAMQAQPGGSMLAVRTDAATLAPLLSQAVEVAACNAPALTVLSGPDDAIDAMQADLQARDIQCTRLRVSHAFHSRSMEGALDAVREAWQGIRAEPGRCPVYSCVSGAPLTIEDARDPGYWARQVRQPVHFSAALRREMAQPDTLFVEVGPGQALTALVRAHREPGTPPPACVALLPSASVSTAAPVHLLGALGQLWARGATVACPVPEGSRRATLPVYPFAGPRFWFDQASLQPTTTAAPSPPALPPAASAPPLPHQENVVPCRLEHIQSEVLQLIANVSGLAPDDLRPDLPLVAQGLDSLSVTQAALELNRVFDSSFGIRDLLERLDTAAAIAAELDAQLPPERFQPEPAAAPAPAPGSAMPAAPSAAVVAAPQLAAHSTPHPSSPTGATPEAIHSLIRAHLALIEQSLALLPGQPAHAAAQQVDSTVAGSPAQASTPSAPVAPTASPPAPATPTGTRPPGAAATAQPFGAAARIRLQHDEALDPGQQRWLDAFAARYTTRTRASKAHAQQHRARMADPRVVTGFTPQLKELVYPIVVDHSEGSTFLDIDGNAYLDLLNAFGANLLGYQPEPVKQAIHEQLERGMEIGPQHPLAGEVAELVAELTGCERVAFCNTGSEAVMGAIRIARTVTGRRKIVMFRDSYHGIFDEVIARPGLNGKAVPAAPGISPNAVKHLMVLDYASDESLATIREHADEIAAVLVEPVQNRHPDLQPREFLQSLRELCTQTGCALVFDEVITGFRLGLGGAQAFYGIRADICTYGKIIGGGLPLAAIAGDSRWLDALDGGMWSFGDDSRPEAGVTYFAGTFVRHPLALAAGRASLLELRRQGDALYARLAELTGSLATRLTEAYEKMAAPVTVVHCGSMWRLIWEGENLYSGVFYLLCRERGLHLFEQFGHFVTAAMDASDIQRIGDVYIGCMQELLDIGLVKRRAGAVVVDEDDGLEQAPTTAPLAPGQSERWLAASLHENGLRALNEAVCLDLEGPLDVAAMSKAVDSITRRHQAFSTAFATDEPTQHVQAPSPLALETVDVSDRQDPERAAGEVCDKAATTRFALDRAPLARVMLVRLSPHSHRLLLVASHLVFDGWSSSVFVDEIAEAYLAQVQSRPMRLPAAESPLAFAATEHERAGTRAASADIAWWTSHLADLPPPLPLGDLDPGGVREFGADTVRRVVQGARLERLKTLCRQGGATLFQGTLASLACALGSLCGVSRLAIGIPYAGQLGGAHPALITDGVYDMPLLVALGERPEPAAVLGPLRSTLMEAMDHARVTQGQVARALGVSANATRPPITGVYFNFNPRVKLPRLGEVRTDIHEARKGGLLGEAFFNFYDLGDRLRLELHYSTDFFSRERAEGVVDAVLRVLDGESVGVPEPTPVQHDPALDTGAVHGPVLQVPRDQRVDEFVLEHLSPGQEIICARGRHDGRQLRQAIEDLAATLRSHGIGRGHRVGVNMPRDFWMLVAPLAVMRTGACYVPMDPLFPAARLAMIAEDAGLDLLLTTDLDAAWAGDIPLLDPTGAIPDSVPLRDTLPVRRAANVGEEPAYVIYTSGSTGRPKGVALSHRSVINFLMTMRECPGLSENDTLAALTTLSFDIAVLEIYLPLVTGSRLVILNTTEPLEIMDVFERERVNVMQATPPSWIGLIGEGWQGGKDFRVLVGGEALAPDLARQLVDRAGEVWNMYGPTETTVWSTVWRVDSPESGVRVGRPVANTRVMLLDDDRRPCAPGQTGEICIGGLGVALGYVDRPELTAERFIIDPTDPGPGNRLYRTGDLGRWDAEGNLEHLGRSDFQIKIRGFRVEPGEIEVRLREHPDVDQAVVVAREFGTADVRLVAYLTPRSGRDPDLAAVRRHLAEWLPGYMRPQHLAVLAQLPLTPNGKIDRRALPNPIGLTRLASEVETPREDEHLALVLGLAREMLGDPDVSAEDNFFEAGGHSLLALSLMVRIREKTGQRIHLLRLANSSLGAVASDLSAPASSEQARGGIMHRVKRIFSQKDKGAAES